VIDATVYGVAVPGTDGRAGMAAIVIDQNFDFKNFADHLSRRLPSYAHPQFLRIMDALDSTETFKQKKQQLLREGVDPAIVTDPLYLRDPQTGAYVPLDRAMYARIIGGSLRL
jgi:fatty-acyl-CoA synthase